MFRDRDILQSSRGLFFKSTPCSRYKIDTSHAIIGTHRVKLCEGEWREKVAHNENPVVTRAALNDERGGDDERWVIITGFFVKEGISIPPYHIMSGGNNGGYWCWG